MPDNITQYENPINGLQPQTRGDEAYVQEGRRVGLFYHQLGADIGGDVKTLGDAMIEHQTNLELANGVKTATDMELQLEVSRPQFFKDNPGPDAAAKWQQHVQEVTTQWSSHFQTERGKLFAAERAGDTMKSEVQKAIGDQVDTDLGTTLESRYGARQNHVAMTTLNPANADREMASIETDDANFRPALMDPGEWAKNHAAFVLEGKELVAGAYYQAGFNAVEKAFETGGPGASTAAYDQVTRDLDTGKYGDLVGGKLPEFRKQLEEARTQGIDQYNRNQEAQVKQSVLAGDSTFLDLYHQYNELRNNGQPLPPDATQRIRQYEKDNPHNTSQSMELERFLTQDTKDQIHQTYVHSDGDLMTGYWQRAALPAGDPNALKSTEVTEAIHEGKLNPVDGQSLIKELAEKAKGGSNADASQWRGRLMQWLSASVRAKLVSGNQDPTSLGGGGADPVGSMAYGEAVKEALDAYQGFVTGPQHMSPQQAFDYMTQEGTNHSFMNRVGYWQAAKDSGQPEDFFGVNQNPDKWIDTHGGWRAAGGGGTTGVAAPPTGGPPTRQPGESPEAFLARTGGQ